MTHTIGDRIKAARNTHTQAWLAERLGVNRSTVTMWENGTRTASVETIARIAALTGSTPQWIAYGVTGD